MESYKLTVHEVSALINKRELSIEELLRKVIQRIDSTESRLDSFITLNIDEALQQAETLDGLIAKGATLPNLAGIPLGVQDNICTFGIRTTCASKMLDNFIPPYNSSVIEKLRQSHSIILGKLNMDEFGMGYSTQNSAFKFTKNPWDLHKVAGGAAGGGAAAVAADQIFYAIGSDVSGCLRQPAAFCGVVGFKPTYGLVSRFGLVACAPSLEQIGCITKDVSDCAYVLEEMVFYDKKDSTSMSKGNSTYTGNLVEDVRELRIGIPKEIFDESWDPDVRTYINNAIETFKKLGAQIVDITLPHFKYASAAHFIISSCESSSNLARYDGVKYGKRAQNVENLEELYCKTRSQGFGQEVKARIMLGNLFLSNEYYDSHYKKALKIRKLLKDDFRKAFEKCNVVLTPTSPILAFDLGHEIDLPIGMSESQRYSLLANMAGIPAISIPCGLSQEGLPIGLQLMADALNEGILIKAAYTFERNTDYHIKKPMKLEVVE